MHHQLSHLHTMRNFEFVYTVKSSDITHKHCIISKKFDFNNQLFSVSKNYNIPLRSSILKQLKCFDRKQVAVPRLLIYS